jgi:hypothetical protein
MPGTRPAVRRKCASGSVSASWTLMETSDHWIGCKKNTGSATQAPVNHALRKASGRATGPPNHRS